MTDAPTSFGDSTPPPSDAAAPPPPPPAFRLLRSRTDRRLGGVGGGLARAAGLDPTLVRIGLVIGALTGWGLVAYLAAWAFIPEEDPGAGRVAVPASENTAKGLRIGLAVVAGLGALQLAGMVAATAFALMAGITTLLHPFVDPFAGEYGGYNPDFPIRGLLGVALLAGGGLYLLRRRGDRPSAWPFGGSEAPAGSAGPRGPGVPAGAAGPQSSGFTRPWASVGSTGPATSAGSAEAATSAGSPLPPAGPVPPAGRARLTGPIPPPPPSQTDWLLLAARAGGWLLALWFAAAAAVMTALWALDALRVRVPALLALTALTALGVLGVSLVRSRRPGVLAGAAAALLVPLALTAAVARWNGTAGYRSVTPSTTAELADSYRHAAGMFRLDLTGLDLAPGSSADIDVTMGAGEVEITVPWDANVVAEARVGAGEFNLLGRRQAGLSLTGQLRSTGAVGGPTLDIRAETSAGQVKVFREDPPVGASDRDGGTTTSPGPATPVDPASPSAPPAPSDPLAPSAPGSPAPAPPTPPTTMAPGMYLCEFPPGGGAASCRPA